MTEIRAGMTEVRAGMTEVRAGMTEIRAGMTFTLLASIVAALRATGKKESHLVGGGFFCGTVFNSLAALGCPGVIPGITIE